MIAGAGTPSVSGRRHKVYLEIDADVKQARDHLQYAKEIYSVQVLLTHKAAEQCRTRVAQAANRNTDLNDKLVVNSCSTTSKWNATAKFTTCMKIQKQLLQFTKEYKSCAPRQWITI